MIKVVAARGLVARDVARRAEPPCEAAAREPYALRDRAHDKSDAFQMTRRQDLAETQDAYSNVTHLQMDAHVTEDEDEFQYSTLLYIWNQEINKGFFKDMKNNLEVLDIQIKEKLNQ